MTSIDPGSPRYDVPPRRFLELLREDGSPERPFSIGLTAEQRDAITDELKDEAVEHYLAIKQGNLAGGVDPDEAEALAVCHMASSLAGIFANALAVKLQGILEAKGIVEVQRHDGE